MISGLTLAGRLAKLLWSAHYRIPEPLYWLLWCVSVGVGTGVTLLGAVDLGVVGLGLAVVALAGIVRWHLDRRRCKGSLVLPRFRTPDGQEARGRDLQRQMSAALQDKLTPAEGGHVQLIPAVLGPDERTLAVRLRRRLRAQFIAYGRISDEGKSIEAGVMEPVRELIVHLDFHTRDITVRKASWRRIFRGLSADRDVVDTQYPPSATADIEALVRAIAGVVALADSDFARAERLLGDATQVAASSTSHQVDQLRVSLARALVAQDLTDDALALLRPRAAQADASPELLRELHALLFKLYSSPELEAQDPAAVGDTKDEAEAALEQAAERRSDPRRETTLYNLAMLTDPTSSDAAREKVEDLVEDLLAPSSAYQRAWYVHRLRGVLAWLRFQRAHAAGDEDRAVAEAKTAARAYSRAIRLRPQFKLWLWSDTAFVLFPSPFPRSAVLHANAYDAHHFAGHRLRSWWHKVRAQRVMQKRMKRGLKMMGRSDWARAYSNFDWIDAVGWVNPFTTRSRVLAAAALQQLGEDERAELEWQAVLTDDPQEARDARKELASNLAGYGLDKGLPGP